jgi:hypothetical protein
VKKTVAYVCVDEDEFGLPVVEKWHIKRHRQYAEWQGNFDIHTGATA